MNWRKISSVWLFALMVVFATTPVVAQANSATSELLNTIKQRSVQAKTLNSENFAVGSNLNEVEAAWGPAEDLGTVAANYWSRNIRFYFDENSKVITDIDDFDPRLQNITLKHVKQKFGKPLGAVELEGNYYVTYKANENHNIIFIFQSAFTNKNPKLELYTISATP